MKYRFRLQILPVFIFLSSLIFCQQAEITNLVVAQRTDGSKLVDITYDISEDVVFSLFDISVEISFDDGSTYVPLTHLTGDVGLGISYGTDKHILWNLDSEYEPLFTESSKFKIIAMGYIEEELPFEMVLVPYGDFTYGEDDEILNIDYDFEIMKYEVTNAQYAEFLIEALESGDIWFYDGYIYGFYNGDEYINGGDYRLGSFSTGDLNLLYWNGTTFIVEEGFGNHPIASVTWFGAWTFANFYGINLPTEQEWEKAARGDTGWDYPWGNSIDGSQANYHNSGDPWDGDEPPWYTETTPIGFYNGQNYDGFQTTDSPSTFGAYDMAGNINEWTQSWWNTSHVRRGGSWGDSIYGLSSWSRSGMDPIGHSALLGFRCYRIVE